MADLNAADQFALEWTDAFIDLNAFNANTRMRVASMLRILLDDLVDAINAADLDAPGSSTVKQRRIKKLVRSVQSTIDLRYRQAAKRLGIGSREVSKFMQGRSVDIINKVFTVDIVSPTMTVNELAALADQNVVLGDTASSFWDDQTRKTKKAFQRQIQQGMTAGETNQQIVQRIRGKATGKSISIETAGGRTIRVRQFKGGVMGISTREADALVRTSVQSVSNDTLVKTYNDNANVLKGYRALTTLDNRTSDICMARTGAAWDLEGNPLPDSATSESFPGPPPWHFNAVVEGMRVKTSRGEIPIEEIIPGDMVLTHAGRFRPVSVTMSKAERGTKYGLHLDSGRVLWVTPEHPLLSASGRWVRADSMKAGDELFQHTEEREEFQVVSSLHSIAEEHPPGFEESFSPDRVMLSPAFSGVGLSVDFQNDLFREYEVQNVGPGVDLKVIGRPSSIESANHELLSPGGVVPEVVGSLAHVSSFGEGVGHGVVALHADRGSFMNPTVILVESPSPMFLSGGPGTSLSVKACRFPLAPDCEPELLHKVIEPRLAEPKASLDGPDGLPIVDVAICDDSLQGGFVHARILRVETKHNKCRVYNLSVAEDETFVAEGVVTHNCRTILSPITKTWEELTQEATGKQKKLLDTVPNSTRASMDGLISTTKVNTFGDWLRIKGDKFARAKLGPGKFDLWKSGKITTSQLIDSAGIPRTLAQLRAL